MVPMRTVLQLCSLTCVAEAGVEITAEVCRNIPRTRFITSHHDMTKPSKFFAHSNGGRNRRFQA